MPSLRKKRQPSLTHCSSPAVDNYEISPFFYTFTALKIAAIILSLVILFNAVVPCSVVDNCEQEEIAATCCDTGCGKEAPEPPEDKDCNDCPPFSICSPAYEFTAASNYATQAPGIPNSSMEFFENNLSLNSEYYSSLFQPPRYL